MYTLKETLVFQGVGIHSGHPVLLTLQPSVVPGIRFAVPPDSVSDSRPEVVPTTVRACSEHRRCVVQHGLHRHVATEHVLAPSRVGIQRLAVRFGNHAGSGECGVRCAVRWSICESTRAFSRAVHRCPSACSWHVRAERHHSRQSGLRHAIPAVDAHHRDWSRTQHLHVVEFCNGIPEANTVRHGLGTQQHVPPGGNCTWCCSVARNRRTCLGENRNRSKYWCVSARSIEVGDPRCVVDECIHLPRSRRDDGGDLQATHRIPNERRARLTATPTTIRPTS